MRSSFCLALTQPMLEFLCATADGVKWDRTLYYKQYGAAKPDSFIASSHALEKRGLIVWLPREQRPSVLDGEGNLQYLSNCRLTPAGAALVDLLKVTGIFVEADAAIGKRSRGAAK